jgi:hypothetical protein
MSTFVSAGILAQEMLAFTMLQWISVVGLIVLIIVYLQIKKRNG